MPISSVAISVEGVLQKNVPATPIQLGIALYHSLSSNFNILLYSEQNKKELDYWLSIEALNKQSAIEYGDGSRKYFGDADRKKTQLSSLRSRGFHIDAVIEPNPSISSILVNEGYSVMTFTHSQYALPSWRPDYQEDRKTWSDFEKSVDRIRELKALDERMKRN